MNLKLTNVNYNATIVKVNNLLPLEGCDNVVSFPIFGYSCIVDKNTKIGDLGVFFPAEVQLSEEYCYENNLFRHSNLNKDEGKTGYIEDSRRIKAVRFRGHKSSGLFMPLESFDYLGLGTPILEEGESFNEINGKEVCRKYVAPCRTPGQQNHVGGKAKKFERIDNRTFPEHLDSENYWKNKHKLKDDDRVIVTQKLHGTSARFGNAQIRRPLRWYERILRRFGVKIDDKEYDYIYGSRKVIKNGNLTEGGQGFYSEDVRKRELNKLKGTIPKDYILYGEIIGWSGGSPIQKDYTYGLDQGTSEFYVYRIAIVNQDGYSTDLSWDLVKEFCLINGLKNVSELVTCCHEGFNVDEFMDKVYSLEYQCVPLGQESAVDEGVCLRVDKLQPYILKAKAPLFLERESKELDSGILDMESQENIVESEE